MKTMRRPTQVALSTLMAMSCGLSTLAMTPANVMAASWKVDDYNFPDPDFRAYIQQNCDTNKDGYLDDKELAIKEIKITGNGKNYKSLQGIYHFSSLETLYIDNTAIETDFDFFGMDTIKYLTIKNCANLDCLIMGRGVYETVDLSNDANLTNVILAETVTSVNVSNCANLEKLSSHEGSLETLDISGCDKLYLLMVDGNKVDTIDITNASRLNSQFSNMGNCIMKELDGKNVVVYVEGQNETDVLVSFDPGTKIKSGTSTYVYGQGTSTSTPATTPAPQPTTAPTAKPTAKPTTAPSKPTTSTPSSDSGVGGFVERLYTVAMGRKSDASGKEFWINEVKMNGKTGADLALSFLLSDEFLGKNMTNDQFLEVLYKTFFDRAGEAGGKKYWTDELTSGRKSKTDVIYGFINSEEWANICLSYGIKSGTDVQATINVEANSQVKGFAERLYTKCLGRASEADGLNYWAAELANLRKSGSDVAYGFFFSDEIKGKNLSDKEFISRLYTTMMGREYDEGGMNYWLGQMKNGSTKEDVFAGFAGSAEWAGICADYGILK